MSVVNSSILVIRILIVVLFSFTCRYVYINFIRTLSPRKRKLNKEEVVRLTKYNNTVAYYQAKIERDTVFLNRFGFIPFIGLKPETRKYYLEQITLADVHLNSEELGENIMLEPENIRAKQVRDSLAFLIAIPIIAYVLNMVIPNGRNFILLLPLVILIYIGPINSVKRRAAKNFYSLQIDFEKFYYIFYRLFKKEGIKPPLEIVIAAYLPKAEPPMARMLTEMKNYLPQGEIYALRKIKEDYGFPELIEFCIYTEMCLNNEDVSEQYLNLKLFIEQREDNRLDNILKARLGLIDFSFIILEGLFLVIMVVAIYLMFMTNMI